jgi:outer membrane protein OmpA-like peptidoglycan-associated protein/uncharacterized protein YidB (DUF937 family)
MGTLDAILTEAGTQFGLSDSKATSLLSSFLSMINETPGGLGSFLDRFRKTGLGDSVSSWLSSSTPRPLSGTTLETAMGHEWIDKIASKTGLTYATASSALAFLIPNVVQRLAPGGVVPTRLPSEALAYMGSATSAVAAGARETAYAAERVVQKARTPGWIWGLLACLALLLIGYWIWAGTRQAVSNTAFNVEEQVRAASQKASAALAALKPGFTAKDLASALNLNAINFATGSAMIPPDSTDYLNRVAVAMKAAPTGSVLEIDGHTDNSGDSASNMALSQQRADAVRTYLMAQGVPPGMLVAKGYGDTRPVASNDTEEGKFRNRRIEFVVQ